MIELIINYNFMQHALIASVLASISCGILGTIIIEKKMVMISGGIAHTAFGGIGLGYYLGIEPIFGALGFAVTASVCLATIKKNSKANIDVLLAIFWAMGMSLGVLFISFTSGYAPDLSSYLFGDILTVSKLDITMMIILDILILFIIISIFNLIKIYVFDENFAKVIKIKTIVIEYVLYILIALTVVILIRIVGLMLVIALLTAPSAIAKLFCKTIIKIMIFAVLLSTFFCIIGLIISYNLNISSGSSIILISGLAYILTRIIKNIIAKKRINNKVYLKKED